LTSSSGNTFASLKISEIEVAAAHTIFALRRVVDKLPSRNQRQMADMTAMVDIFSNKASSPTGASGLSAFVKILQYLLSPTRPQMEIVNSAAHVKYFAVVLRLAQAVDAEAFAESRCI
jgi:hypothetical protein